MEWFKVSSLLPTDPKWKRLSPRAKVAYVEWTCEIAQHETDGVYVAIGKPAPHVKELLAADLVEQHPDGYYIPAFLKWNPSHAELDANRIARSNAGRKAARIRWGDANPMQELEVERELEKPLAPRKRDALFEAVAEVCGIDWRSDLTDSARGALNKACAQLRGVSATLEEVQRRAANWSYPAKLTPSGLAKQWPSLASGNGHDPSVDLPPLGDD